MDAGVDDDRRVMGRVSGVLWVLAAAVGAMGQAMPGVDHEHALVVWALVAVTGLYGLGCVTGIVPWKGAPYGAHLIAVLVAQPLIGLALWVTGGADSYIVAVLMLALLYSAYFLPGWMAWVGVGALALTNASPLLYTGAGEGQALARIAAFALASAGLTVTLQHLKRQLVVTGRRQYAMAHQDPLTGLANRRGFDAALERAVTTAGDPRQGRRSRDPDERFALLLIDLDEFKAVNDGFGHTAGDEVLRGVASRVRAAVRPSDCVARIGGDELAIVAPGAGERGATRLAEAVQAAAADIQPAPQAPPVTLTVSWALFPDQATDVQGLFAAADRALHARKRVRQSATRA
jgi:diguanylate cyclase (GGDEF)-like protein